ncbi:MAG: PAS domain S-box protein [Pirellulales bacterium]|nr:PAS domain S-box protein [Pirellulales bacterium]
MADQQREVDRLARELAETRDGLAASERDRARMPPELERSEAPYRELVENVGSIILRLDPEGNIAFANQFACSFFGYSKGELVGKNVVGTIVPAVDGAGENLAEKIRMVCEHPERFENSENENVRRDGSRVWISWTNRPLRDEQGRFSEVLCIGNDVTARRRAEEALLENERKLSAAVSIAKLGYWEYDVAANLFTFDDHFYAIFRTTAEQMGGYTMSPDRYAEIFVHPDDAHMVADGVRMAMEAEDEDRSVHLEHRMLYADGEIGYMAVTFFVVKDEQGRTVRTFGANQDITDRKRAEEALKASERNYREIFNASTSSVAIVDPASGRFVDVNRAMLDMHGVSREEALRMTVRDISADQSPDAQQKALEIINKAVNEKPQKFEWLCRRRNGQPFWVEVVIQCVIIDGASHALVLASDISDRKLSQQRQLAEQRTLRQLLESQERERQLVAYDIHDGLAQHLAAAAMYCGAFDQLRETNLEEAIKAHEIGTSMIQRALSEARRLISGLRPAALDESGLVAAVENLVSDIRTKEGTEVEFVHDVRFERLDPARENSLFRIIQESLTNAGRYSGSSKIRVRLVQELDRLILEIRDWGRGFDPRDVTEKSFGLMGIRERAGLLGGQATIDSTLGEGTRVRVELPLEETTGEEIA